MVEENDEEARLSDGGGSLARRLYVATGEGCGAGGTSCQWPWATEDAASRRHSGAGGGMKRTPLRRRRRVKPLRKRLWPELSKLIRKRDGQCLMSRGEFGKCGGVLQGSHIYP